MSNQLLTATLTLGLALAGLAGCEGTGMTAAQMAAQTEREEEWRGLPKPGYFEFEHEGKTYVAGSAESKAKVLAGGKFSATQKGFGYGKDGATVYFEDNKIGLGNQLAEEFNKKHGK